MINWANESRQRTWYSRLYWCKNLHFQILFGWVDPKKDKEEDSIHGHGWQTVLIVTVKNSQSIFFFGIKILVILLILVTKINWQWDISHTWGFISTYSRGPDFDDKDKVTKSLMNNKNEKVSRNLKKKKLTLIDMVDC